MLYSFLSIYRSCIYTGGITIESTPGNHIAWVQAATEIITPPYYKRIPKNKYYLDQTR